MAGRKAKVVDSYKAVVKVTLARGKSIELPAEINFADVDRYHDSLDTALTDAAKKVIGENTEPTFTLANKKDLKAAYKMWLKDQKSTEKSSDDADDGDSDGESDGDDE